MNLAKPIAIAGVLLSAQLLALSAEVAVLRNGFTIHCERREQTGNTTRLFTKTGFLDVPTSEIVSFEPDNTPEAPGASADAAQPAETIATMNPATPPATGNTSIAAVNLDQVVREASNRYQLDPDFVNSVIKAESNFQSRAVSPKGALGLMQLMPGTASQLGVADPFDPRANVEGGTAYLSQLLNLYNNDPIKALAAYNAGPNRVEQYHGLPPYMETRAYVARVVRDYNAKKRAEMKARQAAKSPRSAKGTKKKPAPATEPRQAEANKPQKPA
jgi:soluble lytic murein transglycosylase-like protein